MYIPRTQSISPRTVPVLRLDTARNDGLQAQNLDQAVGLEQQDDTVRSLGDGHLGQVELGIGIHRLLVLVADAREVGDLSRSSLCVDSLSVRLLADVQWGGDVDQEEVTRATGRLHELLGGGSRVGVRSNGGSDCRSASPCQLSSNKGDALDVLVSVVGAEAQLGGQLRSNSLTQEQRDRSATLLVEAGLESLGDVVLARVVQAGDEESETLLGLGRVRLAQDLDDGLVREPVRDSLARAEALSQLGTRDVQSLSSSGNLVGWVVLVL